MKIHFLPSAFRAFRSANQPFWNSSLLSRFLVRIFTDDLFFTGTLIFCGFSLPWLVNCFGATASSGWGAAFEAARGLTIALGVALASCVLESLGGGIPSPLHKPVTCFLVVFPLLLAIILSLMAKSPSQRAGVALPWCAAVSHLPQPIRELLGHCLSLQSLWRTHSPGSRIFTPLPFSVEPVQGKSPGMFLYSCKLPVCSSLYYFF